MASTSGKASRTESEENRKEPRRYHFTLSGGQLALYGLGLVLGMAWMFVFGILIGRGLPLMNPQERGLKADIIHFLGLDIQETPPPENVAETWVSPEKMLESLTYFQDLTQTGAGNSMMRPPAKDSAQKEESSDARNLLTKREIKATAEDSQHTAHVQEPSTRAVLDTLELRGVPSQNQPGEYYTLLVGSLKDAENAQKLVEQLKSKGYETRMQMLDLSDSGRWNRVLVGTFESREAAMNFAVDFNRKEHMQGLVIRESN